LLLGPQSLTSPSLTAPGAEWRRFGAAQQSHHGTAPKRDGTKYTVDYVHQAGSCKPAMQLVTNHCYAPILATGLNLLLVCAPVADGPHQPPCRAPPRALARVVARVRSDWASSPRPSARSTETSSVKAPAETAGPAQPAGQSALRSFNCNWIDCSMVQVTSHHQEVYPQQQGALAQKPFPYKSCPGRGSC
jgi:hypothetical protein